MWVLGLVIMVDQVDQNVVRGVVDQLQDDFGINDAQIGLLLSSFVLVNGLVTVPAGYLADRWNRTRTIGHTVIFWSLITMSTALATTFGGLLLLRSLLGFGQAITEPSAARSVRCRRRAADRRVTCRRVEPPHCVPGGLAAGLHRRVHPLAGAEPS